MDDDDEDDFDGSLWGFRVCGVFINWCWGFKGYIGRILVAVWGVVLR